MKFALVLGLCLAFAFVVESFEEDEEFLEDEYKNDKRAIPMAIVELESAVIKIAFQQDCYFSCQDGLECRRVVSGILSYHKCKRPIASSANRGAGAWKRRPLLNSRRNELDSSANGYKICSCYIG
ncbi:hypothetical protein OS493_027496 [Desmophyllum pertusum]|uniref:Uncharacterized protein n=1 Tax=Desmophyllum pertusum TaxID=174260 RepID=A0A9X0CEX1_9CNID|nr:hypothetical protein OS493_027496 [Desmophyllum pertusum]